MHTYTAQIWKTCNCNYNYNCDTFLMKTMETDKDEQRMYCTVWIIDKIGLGVTMLLTCCNEPKPLILR